MVDTKDEPAEYTEAEIEAFVRTKGPSLRRRYAKSRHAMDISRQALSVQRRLDDRNIIDLRDGVLYYEKEISDLEQIIKNISSKYPRYPLDYDENGWKGLSNRIPFLLHLIKNNIVSIAVPSFLVFYFTGYLSPGVPLTGISSAVSWNFYTSACDFFEHMRKIDFSSFNLVETNVGSFTGVRNWIWNKLRSWSNIHSENRGLLSRFRGYISKGVMDFYLANKFSFNMLRKQYAIYLATFPIYILGLGLYAKYDIEAHDKMELNEEMWGMDAEKTHWLIVSTFLYLPTIFNTLAQKFFSLKLRQNNERETVLFIKDKIKVLKWLIGNLPDNRIDIVARDEIIKKIDIIRKEFKKIKIFTNKSPNPLVLLFNRNNTSIVHNIEEELLRLEDGQDNELRLSYSSMV